MKLLEKSLSSKIENLELKGTKYPILLLAVKKIFLFSSSCNSSLSKLILVCVVLINSSTFFAWPSMNIEGIKTSTGLFINSCF